MTDRLYYTDAYLREFDAAVVDRADGGRRIYLDRTAFYPTSGGQPFDQGKLDGAPVVDVVDEGGRIAHLLEVPLTAARVTGSIDWTRRFDHMQQHTGQHLLSAIVTDLFGYATVSVHFGAEVSTLDLKTGSVSREQIAEAERRANEVVTEDRPVEVAFEDAATARGLRKATEREGVIRVVTIQDLDRSACGGTHVRTTGEIGAVLLGKAERVRQLMRLEFLCGGRAVRRARANADLLTRLSASFSATPDELPALTESRQAELKRATSENRDLVTQVSAYRAAELYAGAAPDAKGRRLIVLGEEASSLERLRVLGQAIAALPGAVLVAAGGDPPFVLVAAAADSGLDAGKALKSALQQAGGRGGGNARLAQGTVADRTALDAVIRALSG
jgi:alanyl-tRNA synthetase